jgi:outer membrane lipoprotein-sorting protein
VTLRVSACALTLLVATLVRPPLMSVHAATPAPSPTAAASNGPAPTSALTPAQILQLALDAPRLVDYEGTKVITALRGGQLETITVAESHKRPDAMRLEYLSPENLAGRVIVDNGTVTWHYEPRLNMVFEGPSLEGGTLSRDLTMLLRNHRVKALGVEDVIGRQAYVIVLDPIKPGVQRQLWVDRATGTVLRSEERDPTRGVVLSTYFSRISFSLNLPDAYFQFRAPAGARVFKMFTTEAGSMSPAVLQARVRFPVLIPPVLPEGYTFRGGALSRFGSLESVFLRYSNGGNLISFFEAPAGSIGWPTAGQAIQVEGQPARLVDLGYFRVLIWEQRGLRVTAVATVPTETLITVASQIAMGREQALVEDVAARTRSDPATVRKLRGEGLTFPEVARAIVLSQRLGVDLTTSVRFIRGSITVNDLAARLRSTPDSLRRTVEQAAVDTSGLPALSTAPR